MPYVKFITGHTGTAWIQRYLTKDGRALACDYLNLDAPVVGVEDGLETYGRFDWAGAMDETRHAFGNDVPWRGKPVRTFKHYVMSPDPGDELSLVQLRRLTVAWAKENFADYEVAIVYHDDNENNVPHAHVVVNNTNLASGSRFQEPDPRAVKRSVQRIAREMGLSCFEDVRNESSDAFRKQNARKPATRQAVHRGRAESELEAKGEYSWVADIRSRVEVAKAVARSEDEFVGVLDAMGIAVRDNSQKAARRDWVYSFSEQPSRRVSGEKLGLAYGKAAVVRRLSLGGTGHLGRAEERRIVSIALSAIEVGGMGDLRDLATFVAVRERYGARSVDELAAAKPMSRQDAAALKASIAFAKSHDVLPPHVTATETASRLRPDGERPWKRQPWQRSGKQEAQERCSRPPQAYGPRDRKDRDDR
jgi:hypothetical protein